MRVPIVCTLAQANICTGAVNVSIDTIRQTDLVGFGIICGYMLAVCVFAVGLAYYFDCHSRAEMNAREPKGRQMRSSRIARSSDHSGSNSKKVQ